MDHSRVLVVHVQRTGGTSLRRMLEETQGADDVFPSTDQLNAREGGRYVTPQEILDNWDHLPRHRFLFGHVVASLAELLPVPYARAAFVRDPVERSISITQLHAANTGRPVSDLVADTRFLATHVMDLQTRVFGLDAAFGRIRPQESPPATDAMLEAAIERIRTFEFLGTMNTFAASVARFDATFGTRLSSSTVHVNGSHAGDLPHRELIELFTPLVERDRQLYDSACRHLRSTWGSGRH